MKLKKNMKYDMMNLYCEWRKTMHFFISPKFQIPKTKSQEIQVYPSASAFGVGPLWNLGLGIWNLGFNIKCVVLSRFKYNLWLSKYSRHFKYLRHSKYFRHFLTCIIFITFVTLILTVNPL